MVLYKTVYIFALVTMLNFAIEDNMSELLTNTAITDEVAAIPIEYRMAFIRTDGSGFTQVNGEDEIFVTRRSTNGEILKSLFLSTYERAMFDTIRSGISVIGGMMLSLRINGRDVTLQQLVDDQDKRYLEASNGI